MKEKIVCEFCMTEEDEELLDLHDTMSLIIELQDPPEPLFPYTLVLYRITGYSDGLELITKREIIKHIKGHSRFWKKESRQFKDQYPRLLRVARQFDKSLFDELGESDFSVKV